MRYHITIYIGLVAMKFFLGGTSHYLPFRTLSAKNVLFWQLQYISSVSRPFPNGFINYYNLHQGSRKQQEVVEVEKVGSALRTSSSA